MEQEKMTIHARLPSGHRFGRKSRRVPNETAKIHKHRGRAVARENREGRDSRQDQINTERYGVTRQESVNRSSEKILEMAAKYICNLLDGLCPMVLEKHPCPANCTLETLPWHCWIDYFQAGAAARKVQRQENELESGPRLIKPR